MSKKTATAREIDPEASTLGSSSSEKRVPKKRSLVDAPATITTTSTAAVDASLQEVKDASSATLGACIHTFAKLTAGANFLDAEADILLFLSKRTTSSPAAVVDIQRRLIMQIICSSKRLGAGSPTRDSLLPSGKIHREFIFSLISPSNAVEILSLAEEQKERTSFVVAWFSDAESSDQFQFLQTILSILSESKVEHGSSKKGAEKSRGPDSQVANVVHFIGVALGEAGAALTLTSSFDLLLNACDGHRLVAARKLASLPVFVNFVLDA